MALIIILLYGLMIFLLIRFFMAVHSWDEEIHEMEEKKREKRSRLAHRTR